MLITFGQSLTLISTIGMALAQSSSSGMGAASASSGNTHGGSSGPSTADVDNIRFATYTMICLASIVAALGIYRILLSSIRYIRALVCLNNDTQRYFRQPTLWFASIKEHMIYAPLFRTRHHRELRLFKGWGIGVLPTRFQSLFLAGVIAMNVALCVTGIEWSQAGTVNMLNHLRNRSGMVAVVNMIPLVVMAGRNNPLIGMLNLSFDTFNLIHRWFGRIVAAEAIVHTVAWTVKSVSTTGWSGIGKSLQTSQTVITGFIVRVNATLSEFNSNFQQGLVAFVVIIFQASTALRRAFYEFFLHLHILLVVMSLAALWYHLDDLPQKSYLVVIISAWAAEV